MALILVAEPEGRHVERIRDALGSEGWRVQTVQGAQEALAAADLEPPQLVLVNREIEGAEDLLSTFSRRTGGPGVVALLSERGDGAPDPLADDSLAKPFTDQDLRLAVRRGLAPQPAAPSETKAKASEQLTAADIFGDVVAEVEKEIDTGEAGADGGASPAATAAAPARAAEPEPPSGPARTGPRGELDLEKTLSGLRRELDAGAKAKKPPKKKEKKRSGPRRKTGADGDLDVDALLSETLSGLDLDEGKKKKKKKGKTEARPDDQAPGPGPAPAGETEASAEASAEARAGAGVEEDEEEIELDWGDFEDLEDEGPAPTQVQPPPDFEPSFGKGLHASDEAEGETPEEPREAGDDEIEMPEIDIEGPLQEVEEPAPSTGAGSLAEWLESGKDSLFQSGGEEGEGEATADPAEEQPAAGESRSFGQYTLLDRIAVGGMAEVWKARMSGVEGFQKTVAIKKILPHLTDNDDFVNMFIDEAKLAAQLSHPNIIHIYDLGKIGGHFYIAMEYVEGKNLRAVLNESRKKAQPFPLGVSLLVASRLASALDHAHRKKDFEDRELGLVHRDVSPQNVLLSREGDIKLCDFGIVKAVSKASQTQMGALKGKLQYMSPEQAWGKDVDARSDIFSLGALLFEMLTGQRLFSGDSEISVLEAVRQCRVVAPRDLVPDLPEEVQEVTLRALEQDPEKRYQAAGEMQGELEELLYSIKPTPSQTDLAEFLARVEAAPELDLEERAARARTPDEEGDGALGGTATPPAERSAGETEDRAAEAPAEPPEGTDLRQTGSGTGTDVAQPPPPEDSLASDEPGEEQVSPGAAPTAGLADSGEALEDDDREDDDREAEALPAEDRYLDLEERESRGKLWLWIVLAVVVLAGIGASWYFWQSSGSGDAAPTAPEREVEEPAPPAAEEGAGAEGSDELEAGEEPGGAEPADGATADGATDVGETAAGAPGAQAGETAATTSAEPTPRAAAAATSPRGTPERTTGGTGGAEAEPRSRPARSEPATAEPSGGAREERSTRTGAPTITATSAPPTAAASSEDRPESSEPAERPTMGPAGSADGPTAPAGDAAAPEAAAETAEARDGDAAERADEPGETDDAGPLRLRQPRRLAQPGPGAEEPSGATADDAATASDSTTEAGETADAEGDEAEGRGEDRRAAEERPRAAESPPPNPPVREGDLVGPGPGVRAPRLVSFDKPSYSPLARKMRVEGDVVLSLLVDESGRVTEVRLLKGVRKGVGLNERALDAARRARYEPATKDGVKVKMWTTLRIPFRL